MHLPLHSLLAAGTGLRIVRHAVRVGLMAAISLAASVQADERVPVQLGPSSYCVPGTVDAAADDAAFTSTVGFIVTASSVVVIDAVDSAAQAALLLDAIRRITPKPLSHVLLTRFRARQADGLAALKAAGANIVARRPAQPAAPADADGAPQTEPSAATFQADLWLDDSTDLLMGGVQIQAVASMASPETVYLLPEEGVLFVGDLAAPGRIPDLAEGDARAQIAVLDELLKLGARVVVPAQGPASVEAVAGLQLARDYLAFLHDTMDAAVRQAEPFDEAYEHADWSRFAALPQFDAFNRANASAAYLRMAAPPLPPAQ